VTDELYMHARKFGTGSNTTGFTFQRYGVLLEQASRDVP
jgi:hypothetical protein